MPDEHTPTTSDALLRELSARPDSPRAAEFVRLYGPVLRRFAEQSRSGHRPIPPADRDDLVQEALVAVRRALRLQKLLRLFCLRQRVLCGFAGFFCLCQRLVARGLRRALCPVCLVGAGFGFLLRLRRLRGGVLRRLLFRQRALFAALRGVRRLALLRGELLRVRLRLPRGGCVG
ncbi:MAG: hypothetical protein IJL06_02325, partial [Kiritimatiellae bacterium]|nr:hypothetical protein [Kiritimatiellia bacterium]